MAAGACIQVQSVTEYRAVAPLPETQRLWGLHPSQAGCKVLCRGCSGCKGMHPSIAEIEAVAMLPSTQCLQGRVSGSSGLQG